MTPTDVARGCHVGMSVAGLDEALAFWRRFLGVEPRWHVLTGRTERHLGCEV